MTKKYFILGIIGGAVYVLLEMLWRGYSHWTMFLLGAVCFILIGLVNEVFEWDTPLILQMFCGCAIITALEFVTGCIVNLWLGWDVWDYSSEWGNLLGQICPKFSVIWFFVSALAIVIDDYLRWVLFDEEQPHYRLF